MKFCKNLQRVVDISDPEWAPYWTNYKMLKKLIKELPSLVPSDDNKGENFAVIRSHSPDSINSNSARRTLETTVTSNNDSSSDPQQQNHGDKTGEITTQQQQQQHSVACASNETNNNNNNEASTAAATSSSSSPRNQQQLQQHDTESIGKSPGEVAFFKLLHAEFKKAARFFDRATEEFTIREERVREGMEIMRQPNSIMVNEKWALMAKSIYRLYKDLLLLETFAIMTYCSFSKILKKHDKVTGYETRKAFMENVVNKANFTHYPKVLAMISRCERLYDEVSLSLYREGKEGLYEDERLFINMIHRLNEQVLDSSDNAVHAERNKEVAQNKRRSSSSNGSSNSNTAGNDNNNCRPGHSENESEAASSLRILVEETAKASPVPVSNATGGGVVSDEHNYNNGEDADDDDSDGDGDRKRRFASPNRTQGVSEASSKRARTTA